jgi:hypothetical protein
MFAVLVQKGSARVSRQRQHSTAQALRCTACMMRCSGSSGGSGGSGGSTVAAEAAAATAAATAAAAAACLRSPALSTRSCSSVYPRLDSSTMMALQARPARRAGEVGCSGLQWNAGAVQCHAVQCCAGR